MACAAIARVCTTDSDGLIPDLLAAEITAKTGKNPAQLVSGSGQLASARAGTSALAT